MCVNKNKVQNEFKKKTFPKEQEVAVWLQITQRAHADSFYTWSFSRHDWIKTEKPGLTLEFTQY